MTEAAERKRVDFEVYKFNNRMKKLNKEMKFITVKEVKVLISHPVKTDYKRWFEFWKKN